MESVIDSARDPTLRVGFFANFHCLFIKLITHIITLGNSMEQPEKSEESFIPEGLKRSPRILVVDDEEAILKLLQFHLKRGGCEVYLAKSGEEALELVEKEDKMDLVLLDLRLPGLSGLDTLSALRESEKASYVIIMTAYGTIADAITALRYGAYDFVSKGSSFDDVRLAVRNALNALGLQEEVAQLKMRLFEKEGAFTDLVGQSKAYLQVIKLVRKVTDNNITVLIQGESGCGKELVARAIHYIGEYRAQPFVAINCAAIPENLLESELFGHEKGAFTGATGRYKGKFEEAHEGTLFLDEIGELSMSLQAKLLRVLQTREIQPIGGALKRVKVRIVSATNQQLLQAVKDGRFRQDLYYRLAVFPITVPPLRERQEDIPLLLDHFVETFAKQENKVIDGIVPSVLKKLQTYDWPGNVRELENLIYRAVVLSESNMLGHDDFPSLIIQDEDADATPLTEMSRAADSLAETIARAGNISGTTKDTSATEETPGTLEDMEVATIQKAIADNHGNMSKAAAQLKIGRATLYRKSHKYGLLPQKSGI